MRSALIPMGVVCLILGLAVWWKGAAVFSGAVKSGGTQLVTFLPMLMLAFLMMGFLEALLPPSLIRNWLSAEAGFRGIAVAWGLGSLTPAGGLVGLPLAAALLKSGAGLGVIVTYLTSLSLLSLMRLPMELSIYGARLTAIRVGVSLFIPPLLGMVVRVGAMALGKSG